MVHFTSFNAIQFLTFLAQIPTVRFAKPYSLRKFVNEQIERRNPISPTSTPTDLSSLQNPHYKSQVLRALAYQVLSDINSVAVIMPAALVGTVILTLRGRGVGRNELIRRVDQLRLAIVRRGGRVAEFSGMDTGQVVDRYVFLFS